MSVQHIRQRLYQREKDKIIAGKRSAGRIIVAATAILKGAVTLLSNLFFDNNLFRFEIVWALSPVLILLRLARSAAKTKAKRRFSWRPSEDVISGLLPRSLLRRRASKAGSKRVQSLLWGQYPL